MRILLECELLVISQEVRIRRVDLVMKIRIAGILLKRIGLDLLVAPQILCVAILFLSGPLRLFIFVLFAQSAKLGPYRARPEET